MADTMVPVKNGSTSAPAPTRAEPLGLFDDFTSELEHFWTRPFSLFSGPWFRPFRTLAWAPRMDVFEKDNAIVVKAELPGLTRDDVTVQVEGDDLIIRGERKTESEVKEEDYVRSERMYGSFYRRMRLPAGVTHEQIQANIKDGVLEVRIPSPTPTKAEPKKVVVN
jgi:HSP20 family protein